MRLCYPVFIPRTRSLPTFQSYYHNVARLFVIDNTERAHFNHQLFRELGNLEGIHYISNFENLGIAHALNQALNMAQKEGYDFILTMDQDGALERDYITNLLRIVQKNNLDIATQGLSRHFIKSMEISSTMKGRKSLTKSRL